jgi:hypothetical protein
MESGDTVDAVFEVLPLDLVRLVWTYVPPGAEQGPQEKHEIAHVAWLENFKALWVLSSCVDYIPVIDMNEVARRLVLSGRVHLVCLEHTFRSQRPMTTQEFEDYVFVKERGPQARHRLTHVVWYRDARPADAETWFALRDDDYVPFVSENRIQQKLSSLGRGYYIAHQHSFRGQHRVGTEEIQAWYRANALQQNKRKLEGS